MKKDWLLFTDIVLIVLIGLTTLYSTVVGTEQILGSGGVINRQLLYVLIAFGAYFAVAYFDYRFTGHPQVIIPIYVITAVILLLLLIFGTEVNNAKRWIFIGNFQLQPSEIAKLVVIITTAWLFSLRTKYNVWILGAISFVLTAILAVLVFLEPDAGTAIIIMSLWALIAFAVLPNQLRNILFLIMIVLFAVCANLLLSASYIPALVAGLLAVGTFLFVFAIGRTYRVLVIVVMMFGLLIGFGSRFVWENVLADYQRERVETFLDPGSDTRGSGFQVDQSKVAIGSGLIIGKGFGHGTQSKLNFLPEHQTDFIFAAFAEEFGLLGAVFLLMLYIFAVFRIFQIAIKAENWYGTLICVGVGVKLLLEFFINVGMNLGLIPATGVPLPLMSAGGTIFLITMVSIGLVQSVRMHTELPRPDQPDQMVV